MKPIPASELILNPDGSVYHLNLLPEHLADDIIFVGDPDRVQEVSKHFDSIEYQIHKREFVTHTGRIGSKRLSVISTGIGTDNIDIVWNELNMLANIDLQHRVFREEHRSLRVIRVGTSGALHADIELDSLLVSSHGLGLDVLMHYYPLQEDASTLSLNEALASQLDIPFLKPYLVQSPGNLISRFSGQQQGITATCSGFYAPQGRMVSSTPVIENLIGRLQSVQSGVHRITNFEMETAGIYGLASVLKHEAVSLNAIVANRATQHFSSNPVATVNRAIRLALEVFTS
jgi:uridine phosphorylase